MEQLFETGPRLKAIDQTRVYRRGLGGQGEWWGVKCLDCGQWVTKYDESAEQALELSQGHRCP